MFTLLSCLCITNMVVIIIVEAFIPAKITYRSYIFKKKHSHIRVVKTLHYTTLLKSKTLTFCIQFGRYIKQSIFNCLEIVANVIDAVHNAIFTQMNTVMTTFPSTTTSFIIFLKSLTLSWPGTKGKCDVCYHLVLHNDKIFQYVVCMSHFMARVCVP